MFLAAITIRTTAPNDQTFMDALLTNAAASRQEPGCRSFEVSVSEDRSTVFLYEVYDSPEAFQIHRATPHFAEYDRIAQPRIASKDVQTYTVISS